MLTAAKSWKETVRHLTCLKRDHSGHQVIKIGIHGLREALVGCSQLHVRILEQPARREQKEIPRITKNCSAEAAAEKIDWGPTSAPARMHYCHSLTHQSSGRKNCHFQIIWLSHSSILQGAEGFLRGVELLGSQMGVEGTLHLSESTWQYQTLSQIYSGHNHGLYFYPVPSHTHVHRHQRFYPGFILTVAKVQFEQLIKRHIVKFALFSL